MFACIPKEKVAVRNGTCQRCGTSIDIGKMHLIAIGKKRSNQMLSHENIHGPFCSRDCFDAWEVGVQDAIRRHRRNLKKR